MQSTPLFFAQVLCSTHRSGKPRRSRSTHALIIHIPCQRRTVQFSSHRPFHLYTCGSFSQCLALFFLNVNRREVRSDRVCRARSIRETEFAESSVAVYVKKVIAPRFAASQLAPDGYRRLQVSAFLFKSMPNISAECSSTMSNKSTTALWPISSTVKLQQYIDGFSIGAILPHPWR